jgi:hypothetical protein
MICAELKTTVNSELQNLTLVRSRQLGSREKRATTGKSKFWTFVQLGILNRELGPLSRATTWRSLISSWLNFFCVFCFESTINLGSVIVSSQTTMGYSIFQVLFFSRCSYPERLKRGLSAFLKGTWTYVSRSWLRDSYQQPLVYWTKHS